MHKGDDFLDELAELALGSRLKRLSDRLLHDANQVYREFGHEIPVKYFTLLMLLKNSQGIGVVEAATYLGLSQPAISQFVRELVAMDLVISVAGKQDSRKKTLSLSEGGEAVLNKMQVMQMAVDAAAKGLCEEAGGDFYQAIRRCEAALSRKSLLQRTLECSNE